MRRTKTVYTFDSNNYFVGTTSARESWDSVDKETPIWLLPANSTEEEPPFSLESDQKAIWNETSSSWEVFTITPENTPKPEFDENRFDCVWSGIEWKLEPKPKKLTWDDIRAKRNYLISSTDWVMFSDVAVSNKEAWLTYRQALRDLPQSFSSPEEVVFPSKPE